MSYIESTIYNLITGVIFIYLYNAMGVTTLVSYHAVFVFFLSSLATAAIVLAAAVILAVILAIFVTAGGTSPATGKTIQDYLNEFNKKH